MTHAHMAPTVKYSLVGENAICCDQILDQLRISVAPDVGAVWVATEPLKQSSATTGIANKMDRPLR